MTRRSTSVRNAIIKMTLTNRIRATTPYQTSACAPCGRNSSKLEANSGIMRSALGLRYPRRLLAATSRDERRHPSDRSARRDQDRRESYSTSTITCVLPSAFDTRGGFLQRHRATNDGIDLIDRHVAIKSGGIQSQLRLQRACGALHLELRPLLDLAAQLRGDLL